jgi:NAD(P)-dependent dehydrogenase (short-subunit alcohol dehydrogenase family)
LLRQLVERQRGRLVARNRQGPQVARCVDQRRLAQKKQIQIGRLGLPEEAARAIMFLASPLSSYTTGSHIDVSGGLSRHV